MIHAVACMDNGGVIGKGNYLSWVCKPDMDRLKQLVKGKPIIIGGRTYDNLSGVDSFIRKEKSLYVFRRSNSGNPWEDMLWFFNSEDVYYLLGGEWMYDYFFNYISKWHLSNH